MRKTIQIKNKYKIKIINTIPEHSGLGSKTQLSLAVAVAISKLEGYSYTPRELAKIVHRGGTSGIGVAAFEHGGFIFDAGHSVKEKKDFLPSHYSNTPPPPIIFRQELPSDWYFVLITPKVKERICSKMEKKLFQEFCPIPVKEVEKLSRLILMKTIPAILEKDIQLFGESLTEIQNIGFKRIENKCQQWNIKALYRFLDKKEVFGRGLSSFGPTVYAITEGKKNAIELSDNIADYCKNVKIDVNVTYSNARNTGAGIYDD
jgi:beta-ribofuranosylaminobenzene 5'-phosphate synthase